MLLLATTSATASVGGTGGLTTIALIVIALFALLVILGIAWGAKQKRARAAGEREEQGRSEALTAHRPTAAPTPVAEPEPVAAPVFEPAPPPAPTPIPAASDDLTAAPPAAPPRYRLIDVKGLGPRAVPLLTDLGVADLATLAGLSATRAAEIDGQLGVLSGRMARDRWVEQARLLTAGQVDEFQAAFGKL